MCGILFRIANEKPLDDILKYFELVKYRGPDYTNVVEFETKNQNRLYFCHHRLGIIKPMDPQSNQPFETDEYILIANAEIYNYESFSSFSGDCQSIATLLMQEGSPRLLDGDFAFVFYNKVSNRIIAARDTVGLKPLYIGYNIQNKIIGFTSEPKCFQYDDDVSRIEPLHPGTICEINLNTQTGCPLFKQFNMNYVTTKLVRKYITHSVQKRIQHADVPVGILCSGGIDSSIITAIASKKFPEREFEAFVVEYSSTGMKQDSFFAEMLVESLPRDNIHLNIYTFTREEGVAVIETVIQIFETYDVGTIRAGIPMYLLARHISENTDIKVLLSGDGADELFMGSEQFRTDQISTRQAKDESLRLLDRMHEYDLLRAERSFSCNGLEIRTPYLDRDTVQFISTIPGKMLLPQGGVEKYLLRKAFGYSLDIPQKVLERSHESLAEGVGHAWIPDLIRHCQRFGGEEMYYKNVYDKYFPHNKVIFN